MRLPRGSYYKIKTYADGKRERLLLTPEGRVLERTALAKSKTRRTKSSRRLMRRRKRIGR